MMKTTIKFFTKEELNYFFGELEKERLNAETEYARNSACRNEAMFKIMYYCALRVSEVCLLRTCDFNPLNNELHCTRLKDGLNNTLRILDKDVLRALKRHIKVNCPETYLFESSHSGKMLSRKTIDHIFKRIGNKTEMKCTEKFHCHTLRHSRAVALADDGLDMKEIQYWLGHSDISNTQIYFQFTSRQQETLYQKIRKSSKNTAVTLI